MKGIVELAIQLPINGTGGTIYNEDIFEQGCLLPQPTANEISVLLPVTPAASARLSPGTKLLFLTAPPGEYTPSD